MMVEKWWGGPATHLFLMFLMLAKALSISDVVFPSKNPDDLHRNHESIRLRSEKLLSSLITGDRLSLFTPIPAKSVSLPTRVYYVTDYGADPTGTTDSTVAIKRAISDACRPPHNRHLMSGIADLGGPQVNLAGGTYLISSPIVLHCNPVGNLKIHDGSLRASDNFPVDSYVIELRSNVIRLRSDYHSEFITLSGLMIDANYRGGGISVINSLRTIITGCYVIHFASDGIYIESGHESLIINSFIGQRITAGMDPLEKQFSGTGIRLVGNDNVVTDVVIFSAAVGILIMGQANTITGVHCYNKATGFGGTGIYLKLPGLTQTRITNCYLDYTGIVSEDPVQLHISGSFFLGDANVVLKSVKGVMRGVNVVNNIFSGSGGGVNIVRLDESLRTFTAVDQVFVGQNIVEGMVVRSTVGKASVEGQGTMWVVDFRRQLLFPNRIDNVHYALRAASKFPKHALRSVSNNRVLIETDVAVQAKVYVQVDQCGGSMA